MRFALSSEQVHFQSGLRDFLTARSDQARVREVIEWDEPLDRDLWRGLASELGVVGLAIPEQYGGAGASFVELAIAAEELGRSLACVPFLSTSVLAVSALLDSNDVAACEEFLPEIAKGETIVAVAIGGTEIPDRDGSVPGPVVAESTTDGWRLRGEVRFVLDASFADAVVVVAETAEGPSLFLVNRADALVEPLVGLDLTRQFADVRLDGSSARLLGRDGEAGPILSRVADLGAVALAADALGGAQCCLDMAVEYAKIREQFGKPIGSFQAIKHKCATVLLEVESARVATYYAAWAAAASPDDLMRAASIAKSYCSDSYVHASQENIQIHGGIGFSWEHPAHLYFRRAKSSQLWMGSPAAHRERLADLLEI